MGTIENNMTAETQVTICGTSDESASFATTLHNVNTFDQIVLDLDLDYEDTDI